MIRRHLVSGLPMRMLVRQMREGVVRWPAVFGQRTHVGGRTTFLGHRVIELGPAGVFAGGSRG